MFWKYNSLNVSNIDTLLEKQEVTLTEILQQEDIIQECKSQNKKLVEFLTKQEVLSELLDLILKEPPTDIEEKLRYHLPNIASELITCDVPQINEKLSSDVSLLDKMYSFLDNEPPLNPLLTSFFSKAFGVLITRRSDQNWYSYQYTCLQVIEYIKTKPCFSSLLLKHMGTSAVMDLLLRLITCVEGTEMKQNILGWLNSERLIERVVGLLGPSDGGGEGGGGELTLSQLQDKHDNAGQLLVEIVRVSRDSQINAPTAERFLNPLLNTAESPETVELLLTNIFSGEPRESIIINGVNVLMSLLEIRKPGPTNAGYYPYTTDQETGNSNEADIARQQAVLEKTVETILPRLGALSNVLQNPPVKPSFRTTYGLLDPPLGATRLALAKLTATVLSTHHPPTNHAVAQTNVLDVLLDLFFKYSLNNFLHSQVESCIKHILFWKFPEPPSKSEDTDDNSEVTDSIQTPKIGNESENPLIKQPVENPLLVHLFSVSRLVERIVDAFEDNDETSTSSGRKAYMGHLTGIANAIVLAGSEGEDGCLPPSESRDILLQEMNKLPESTTEKWNKLVSGTLLQLNKLNEIKPTHEDKRNSSSDDEDADFRDINFPQDTALQQMQQMSDNFIDSFGFNDEEFTEADENVGGGMRKLTSVNFLMATDESNKQQQLFEAACEQRIKPFRSSPPPGEAEEDPWAERTAEISFGAGVGMSGVNATPQEDKDTDSEEDEDVATAPARMEVDSEQDPWESVDNAPVAMDTASPWGEAPAASAPVEGAQEEGWADFGGFSSAGGEGFASFAAFQDKQESMEENGEKKDSDHWSPAMVSSPEATTLDDPVPDTPPSPSTLNTENDVETPMALAEEKYTVQRPESPDISDSNANPAPVPSDIVDIVDREEEDEAKATDNFSFLASRGLLSNQDNLQLPAKPESEASIQSVVEASGPA